MRIEEFDIEEQLRKDAKNIKIDQQFKMDLKERIMAEGKKSNVVKMQNKRKIRFNKYFKIASSFMICVFVGGTLYKVTNMGSAAKLVKPNETDNNRIAIKEVLTISTKTDMNSDNIDKRDVNNDDAAKIVTEEDGSSEILKEVKDDTNIAVIDEQSVDAENKGESANDTVIEKNNDNLVDNDDSKIDSTVKSDEQQNNSTEKENKVEEVYATAEEIDAKDNNEVVNSKDLQQENNNQYTKKNTKGIDNIKEPEEDINKMIINKNQRSASGKIGNVELGLSVPEMKDIKKENEDEIFDRYNPIYSKDKQKKILMKYNGIYVKQLSSGEESLVVNIDSDEYIVERPNFLPNEDIIYAKVDKNDANTSGYEIYQYVRAVRKEKKLTDGKNPFISQNGKKLAYEFGGKICIFDFDSNVTNIIDDGKYPAWSYDGKYLSYVKEQNEREIYDEATKEKNVYLKKEYSTMWIYNVEDNNKYAITNVELVANDNNEIKEWAQDVIEGKTNCDFEIFGKYTYFESIWAENNKEIYAIRRDNKSNVNEYVKFNLDGEN